MLNVHTRPPSDAPPAQWLAVAELQHRVMNDYAAAVASISLAAAGEPSSKAQSALSQTAERLRSRAEVHRALQVPQTEGLIDLGGYLHTLCDAVIRADLSERGVLLSLVEEEIPLDAGRCWRVGLIVSELITNAVRHGFRGGGGRITVEVASADGRIQCRVSDDGRPIGGNRSGRGTAIVRALAAELRGAVEWRFGAAGGEATLFFPE